MCIVDPLRGYDLEVNNRTLLRFDSSFLKPSKLSEKPGGNVVYVIQYASAFLIMMYVCNA